MLTWLGDGRRAAGWTQYLRSDELAEQLALGSKADKTVLREILARYASGAPGLSNPRFVAVRAALQRWLEELMVPSVAELPRAAREAKEHITLPTEESLRQSMAAARRALAALEQYLGVGPAGQGWTSLLRLDDLKQQLAADAQPNIDVLADVSILLSRDYRGLEQPPFRALGDALASLLPQLRLRQDPQAVTHARQHLETLATALESYGKTRDWAELRKAAAAIDWLRQRRVAEHVTQAARQHYWKPNLLMEASAELVTYGFGETLNEGREINEWRNEARLIGHARTSGRVVASLVPNQHVGVIHAVFRGRARSHTNAFASRATVNTYGDTSIHAIKQIVLGRRGFYPDHTTAAANTATTTTGLSVRAFFLFQGIARSKAMQRVNAQRAANEHTASRRAEAQIKRRMDRLMRQRLQAANDGYYSRFIKPLSDYGAFPSTLRFHSTRDAVHVTSIQASGTRLAALSDPPRGPPGRAVMLHVHESWLNHTAAAMYGGRAVKKEEFLQEVTNLLGETPEQLKDDKQDNRRSWTITFADEGPVTFYFGTNRVILTLRGTRFRFGRAAAQRIPMTVSVAYNVAQGPKLVRLGDVQAFPSKIFAKLDKDGDVWLNAVESKGVKAGLLNAQEAGLRGELIETFDKLLDKQIRPEPRKLRGRWEPLGELQADHVSADGRWFSIGYSLDEPTGRKTGPSL